MFKTIKKHYDAGRYTKENVKVFVQAKWITVEQYEEITGDKYAV